MQANAFGRTYSQGKALNKDLRSLIVDVILSEGGDVTTGYYPGNFRDIERRFKVTAGVPKRVWNNFCKTGRLEPHRYVCGVQSPLEQPELELVRILKENRPSITYNEIKENVERFTAINPSIAAIGRAVRSRLSTGIMTWKKMIRPSAEKFTPENIEYCQMYVNFMNTLDPHRIKFLMRQESMYRTAQTQNMATQSKEHLVLK